MLHLLVISENQSERQQISSFLQQTYPKALVNSCSAGALQTVTPSAIVTCAGNDWAYTQELLSFVRTQQPRTPHILYGPNIAAESALALLPLLIDDFVLGEHELDKTIKVAVRRHQSKPSANIKPPPGLLDSLSLPLLTMNKSGRVTYHNQPFIDLFGQEWHEIVGQEYTSAFSGVQFQKLRAAMTMALTTRQTAAIGIWPFQERLLRVSAQPTPAGLTVTCEDVTEQHKELTELRQSEAQLGLLFSMAPIGMVITTTQGNILTTNLAFQQLVGYSAAELHQLTFQDITHPDDMSFNSRLHQQLLQGEIADYSLEKRYLHKDGRTIHIFLQVTLVRDQQGNPRQLIGQAVDITELKEAEQARLETEKRLDQTFDLAPFGMLVVAASGRVQRVNDAFCNFSGYDVESLMESSFYKTLRPSDAELAPQLMKRLVNNQGEEIQAELVFRTRAGRNSPALLQMSRFPSEDENEPNILTMVVDLTERQAAEDELRRQARDLSILFTLSNQLRQTKTVADVSEIATEKINKITEASFLVLYLADPGRHSLRLQQAWPRNIQLRRQVPIDEGIIGKVFRTGEPYLSPEIPSDPTAQLTDYERRQVSDIGTGLHFPLEAEGEIFGVLAVGIQSGVTLTNKQLDMLTTIAALTESALHRAMVVETLEQRVEERTLELATANERLKELDKLKSKFVSDVSHELRTPVTNLNLYLDLLKDGRADRRAHYEKVLKEQASRLRQLTEDILDLSRLELANNGVSLVPTDLNALVNKVFIGHKPRAADAGLRLTAAFAESLPPIEGEPNQLTQVITNLVSNAIIYTPAGFVHIETEFDQANNEAAFSVTDSGYGIDPDDLRHIFDRFYRGRQTGQLTIPGTGLGLAIAKEVVDLHRGRIEITPRPEGGTIMRVSLPIRMAIPA